jgi:lysyl-tRNA synthetase, class I
VTGGNVKLQWKPDFGARWAALDVDFEMYGKDHSTNTPIYDGICEILGGRAPEHFVYELFLDDQGQKISKSKGNGLTIDEWLTYAATESLSYFMYQKPKTAKRLWWDVIPKAVDEYHQQLRAYPDAGHGEQQLANPVWHIHGGKPPESRMVVSFAMLLNLASVAGAQDKAGLWGFIRRYAPEASPETHPDLDAAAEYAVRYFRDFVAPDAPLPPADPREARRWPTWPRGCGLGGRSDAEALQSMVFASARSTGSSRCATGSARSTRCCWAPRRGRASAASWRSTASTRPWR